MTLFRCDGHKSPGSSEKRDKVIMPKAYRSLTCCALPIFVVCSTRQPEILTNGLAGRLTRFSAPPMLLLASGMCTSHLNVNQFARQTDGDDMKPLEYVPRTFSILCEARNLARLLNSRQSNQNCLSTSGPSRVLMGLQQSRNDCARDIAKRDCFDSQSSLELFSTSSNLHKQINQHACQGKRRCCITSNLFN